MRRKTSSFLLAVVGIGLLGLAQRSIAQTDMAERKEKTGVTIVTLGTGGGPTPQKERAQPANLLVVNGTIYLVDAGAGVTTRIVQSGYDFKKIGKIFITHLHSDHTNGLASLLAAEWDASRHDPIDIYGSRVETLVKGAIEYLTPNADIRWTEGTKTPMKDVFHGHNVEPGLIYQDENVKLIAVENTHYHFAAGSPPYGRDKSYSYRFEAPGRVVVFTGDTGPSDALTELARGADVLVTEVGTADDKIEGQKRTGIWQKLSAEQQAAFVRHVEGEHLTPKVVGTIAAKAGVKEIVMTHLSPTIDPNDKYQRYVDEAKKYFSGPILLAKDLDRF